MAGFSNRSVTAFYVSVMEVVNPDCGLIDGDEVILGETLGRLEGDTLGRVDRDDVGDALGI